MKQEYQYFKASLLKAETVIQFESLIALYNYTEYNHISSILILLNDENIAADFAVLQNAAILKHSTEGYISLEDYFAAYQNQFTDAGSFYDARELGYKKYEEYKLVKETGISNKHIYDKIKQNGFIQGYLDFTKLPETNTGLPVIESPITNAFLLYDYVIKNGFDKYKDFEEAYLKGFTDKSTYNVATEFGFPNNTEYQSALHLGFRTYLELTLARKHKARDREDYIKLHELMDVGDKMNSNDEKLLMVLLSKIEQGKRISLNKLYDLFIKAINEYCYTDTLLLPEWFTKQFDNRENFVTFLTKDTLRPYGEYDEDGEFFQINKMQDREVILDASNVAYNSTKGSAQSKAFVSNILKMVDFLKDHGFHKISVLADASLRYRLADPDKLKELEGKVDYRTAPAETSADIFIINYVKSQHCLLVSNDTFKDWKNQDPWVANNIDFYRLSFMIKENEILMPDLKV